MMTEDQKRLYLEWADAWEDKDATRMDAANAALKATGLRAYESSQGFPFVEHWYNGPNRFWKVVLAGRGLSGKGRRG